MSTRSSIAFSRRLEIGRVVRLHRWLFAATAILAFTAGAAVAQDTGPADAFEPTADGEAHDENPANPLDPVSEVVQGDALTQIRISAIAFQNPKNLGQALSGVIGAFLKRDRLKDAMVDLSVIHDPVWRAYALLHFAEYHYARGELDTVRSLLQKADTLTKDLTARREEETVLGLVSQRLAEYGNFAGARRTASRIPAPHPRIRKFLEIAELQAGDFKKDVAAGSVETLRLAFEHTKKATIGREERLDMLLSVANTAIALHHPKLAQQVVEFGYGMLAKSPHDGSTTVLAEFAAAMVRAGARRRAMEIVRSMKNDISRGYSLASVARAFADTGSIEGAVPLFYLALQDADTLEDGPVKTRLLTHIIREQTRAGRLADAFSAAGKINGVKEQQAALFEMAAILLDKNEPLEALKLVDYLPDIGMRAQILSSAARHYSVSGDKKKASALLLKAVDPTNAKPNIETLAEGIPLIFETQAEIGKSPDRDAVLAGARKLLKLIPNEPVKVPVMTRIARAEMRDKQRDDADRSLGAAWRIAWFNKNTKAFPALLTDIALAQLNMGELLLAFDTAARISSEAGLDMDEIESMYDRRQTPKVKALTAVAVAAARQSEAQLALRAARAIPDVEGRASAYREIALAFPVANQEASLGKGAVPMHPSLPGDPLLSPAVRGAPAKRN